MKRRLVVLLALLGISGCIPKKNVEFRRILNVRMETVSKTPVLKGDVVFYNPNKTESKLEKIELDILIGEKKAGTVNQILNQKIEGEAEFTVPIEVNVSLKESGLLDTLINIFSSKKKQLRILGKVKVRVHGIGINVPVDHTEEIKLKL